MGCGSSSAQPQSGQAPQNAMAAAPAPLPPLMGLVSDVAFPVPAEDVQKSSGLAFDIGSTVGKIIYRSNKEYKNGEPIKAQEEGSQGQVHFAMFPRSDVDGMVQYIKDNADLTANEKGEIIVNSSGVGGAAFKKPIEAGLSCKMEILPEFDCFCKALLALEKSLPAEELLLPVSEKVEAAGQAFKAQATALMKKNEELMEMKFGTQAGGEEEMKEEDRPRLLVMAGSGTGVMLLTKDGTFTMVDGLYTAGRFMYGLASFLTGENDFKKLVALAEKGDGRTTDVFVSDLLGDQSNNEGEEANVYTAEIDMNMFAFGKGIASKLSEVKKEDLAFSAFNTVATLHAQVVHSTVKITKAKDVYFAGNVFNTELMRDRISLKKFELDSFLPGPVSPEYHFLKNGGMYGAMGAFLHTKKPAAE